MRLMRLCRESKNQRSTDPMPCIYRQCENIGGERRIRLSGKKFERDHACIGSGMLKRQHDRFRVLNCNRGGGRSLGEILVLSLRQPATDRLCPAVPMW